MKLVQDRMTVLESQLLCLQSMARALRSREKFNLTHRGLFALLVVIFVITVR